MDPRKWIPSLPLFRSLGCLYCGGSADTKDHTPPQCLLPKPLPTDVQIMTVPACSKCNKGFQQNEMRTAVVIATVSFTQADQAAVAPGGCVHSAMQRDATLRQFVQARLGSDGVFRPDSMVLQALSEVMTKTAAGLFFHEFGRIVPLSEISLVAIEHTKNVNPSAFAENYRRLDSGWAEVRPSGRELERQVVALMGNEPPHVADWRLYVPRFFEYLLLDRSNDRLLMALKLHDALVVLLECPRPSRAGPRRKGRPPYQTH